MPQPVREALGRILTAAAMLWAGEAAAFMIVPVEEDPDRIIVEIERSYGDRVPLRTLPPPYNHIVQTMQGPKGLSFRWQYFRSSEQGLFYIHVGDDGVGSAHFEFAGSRLADGDTLGAAAVLVDARGRPMHAFLAKADVEGDRFAGGDNFRRFAIELERPPEWWGAVDALVMFNMKYYAMHRPPGEAVWDAMRRAVVQTVGSFDGFQRPEGG